VNKVMMKVSSICCASYPLSLFFYNCLDTSCVCSIADDANMGRQETGAQVWA